MNISMEIDLIKKDEVDRWNNVPISSNVVVHAFGNRRIDDVGLCSLNCLFTVSNFERSLRR
jgi:hypothetical protein